MTREQKFDQIRDEITKTGVYTTDAHTLGCDGSLIRVYAKGGALVAYSSMRGDFDQSLDEFIADYLM